MKTYTGRCTQEGVRRKAYTGRHTQEGVHRKMYTGRCTQEGGHRKTYTRRCTQEGVKHEPNIVLCKYTSAVKLQTNKRELLKVDKVSV